VAIKISTYVWCSPQLITKLGLVVCLELRPVVSALLYGLTVFGWINDDDDDVSSIRLIFIELLFLKQTKLK